MDRFRNSNRLIEWLLAVVNVTGIALFLVSASLIWAPPEEKGLYGGPGDPIIWTFFAFPFLAICTLFNFVMSRGVLIQLFYYRDWRPFLLWLMIIAIWFGAIRYDASRHYDGSWVSQDNPGNP
jgi:hypothetical protein